MYIVMGTQHQIPKLRQCSTLATIFMKSIILLLCICLCTTYVSGQDIAIPDYKGEKESFSRLKDKTIRKEIATFTDAGGKEADPKLKLKGLTLIRSGASFSTFLNDSIYVHVTIGK